MSTAAVAANAEAVVVSLLVMFRDDTDDDGKDVVDALYTALVYTNSTALPPTPTPPFINEVALTLACIPSTHIVRSTPLARALGAGGLAHRRDWGVRKVPGTVTMPTE